jgi:hypothetical protein
MILDVYCRASFVDNGRRAMMNGSGVVGCVRNEGAAVPCAASVYKPSCLMGPFCYPCTKEKTTHHIRMAGVVGLTCCTRLPGPL